MSVSTLLTGYLWAALAYVLAGLVALIIKTKRSPNPWRRNDFSEVRSLLSALLRRGYDKGYLALTHEKSGRFLKVRKVIRETGDYGLELCLPRLDWSEAYFQSLRVHCENTNLPHRVQSETFEERRMDVLAVDCGQDAERAYDLAATIWTKLFGLPSHAWYELKGDGVSVHDELVDSSDHPRLSEEEILQHQWHRLKQRCQKENLTFTDVFYTVALTIVSLISIIGLPVATLLSIGDPSDWAIDLGGIQFAGSSASLIFFLAYLFSFAVLRQLLKEKFAKILGREKSKSERISAAGLQFIVITLPLAVILIWAGV